MAGSRLCRASPISDVLHAVSQRTGGCAATTRSPSSRFCGREMGEPFVVDEQVPERRELSIREGPMDAIAVILPSGEGTSGSPRSAPRSPRNRPPKS